MEGRDQLALKYLGQLRLDLAKRLRAVEALIETFGEVPELEEPIRCGVCGKELRNTQGLGSHMVKVHPDAVFERAVKAEKPKRKKAAAGGTKKEAE